MLLEAHLSQTMTKLFAPVAAQNHRHYNFRIHVIFNLFQYIHLQSMVISRMSGVFFFDYPAFNKQSRLQGTIDPRA